MDNYLIKKNVNYKMEEFLHKWDLMDYVPRNIFHKCEIRETESRAVILKWIAKL